MVACIASDDKERLVGITYLLLGWNLNISQQNSVTEVNNLSVVMENEWTMELGH